MKITIPKTFPHFREKSLFPLLASEDSEGSWCLSNRVGFCFDRAPGGRERRRESRGGHDFSESEGRLTPVRLVARAAGRVETNSSADPPP